MLKFYCYSFNADKTTDQIIDDINELCNRTKQYKREEDIMLFVFVPTVSLEAVCKAIPDRKLVKISSQGFSTNKISSELTPEKLREIGADMAITGLADRRYYRGVTNEETQKNLEVILNMGFKSMLCVGETEEMAQNGTAKEVIAEQIKTGYANIPYEAHYRIGTIYRPLWAFDRSGAFDLNYTEDMFRTIKEATAEALPGFPIEMPLFYGGKLDAKFAEKLFESETVDGVFVDSKDMSVDEFVKMIDEIG